MIWVALMEVSNEVEVEDKKCKDPGSLLWITPPPSPPGVGDLGGTAQAEGLRRKNLHHSITTLFASSVSWGWVGFLFLLLLGDM